MPDKDALTMGLAIAAAREDRRLERGELADRAGVSHPYLAELEQGRRSGTPQVLERIAAALHVSVAELDVASSAIAAGGQPSFPPSFLHQATGGATTSPLTVDVRQPPAARPPATLRPMAPQAQKDEDVIVARLTARVRAEVERWLDRELEAAVRAEVRSQHPGT